LEFSFHVIQKVPASDNIACRAFGWNEIDDGYSLICVECERQYGLFLFPRARQRIFRACSASVPELLISGFQCHSLFRPQHCSYILGWNTCLIKGQVRWCLEAALGGIGSVSCGWWNDFDGPLTYDLPGTPWCKSSVTTWGRGRQWGISAQERRVRKRNVGRWHSRTSWTSCALMPKVQKKQIQWSHRNSGIILDFSSIIRVSKIGIVHTLVTFSRVREG
jgi:hypothetical protein